MAHTGNEKKRLFLPSGRANARKPAPGLPGSPTSRFPFGLARLKPGETVLDPNCGGGADVLEAARLVGPSGQVYGLEHSREVLNLALGAKDELGAENVRLYWGSAEKIPLPDSRMDVCFSNWVLHAVKDREKALKEAFRVLKPGGRMVVSDIACIKKPKSVYIVKNDPASGFLKRAAGMARYARILKGAGFARIRMRSVPNEAFLALLYEYKRIFGKKLRFTVWPVVIMAVKPF